MSPRRTAALVALAAVTAGAALLTLARGLLPVADQLRATGRDAASSVTSVAAIEPRWVAPVTGWPSALAADRVGAVVLAGGGEVRAIEPDGTTRWRVDVPGAGFHPPGLDPTTVLVGAGERIVALDRETGATRWEAAAPDATAGPVAVADGYALAGTEAGALLALDARTGEARWSVLHPGSIRSAPVVSLPNDTAEGLVAATWHGGSDPRLRALDLATGAPRWDAPLLAFATAPVASHGLVVVGEGDGQYTARVVARGLRDGVEAWSTPVPASFESGITPAASGDDVAVVDHFGTVTVLDAGTGAVRTTTELDEPVLRTTVLLGGEHLALTTHPGAVVVVDRRSGRVRYRGSLGGYPAAIARSGPDLLVAVRLRDPGRVESIPLPLH